MSSTTGRVLLKPGDVVRFSDRDELLQKLAALDQRIPSRSEGRTKDQREHFCIVRFLRYLAGAQGHLLPTPLTLQKTAEGSDPPDFVLRWDDGSEESFEVTEGSTQAHQRELALASREDRRPGASLDVQIPDRDAEEAWADVIFQAFRRKAAALIKGRFSLDHLLIYDLTGLGMFGVPLEFGGPLLRSKVQAWQEQTSSDYQFRRISVLRDLALLYDVTGVAKVLQHTSPRVRLSKIRATSEAGLKERLRRIESFCSDNSIHRLKLFGSVLGDVEALMESDDEIDDEILRRFTEGSDIDVLVEFEEDARVTLLDMVRLERELSELIGLKIDLRTAGDLSRYFREQVLSEAVEISAQHA